MDHTPYIAAAYGLGLFLLVGYGGFMAFRYERLKELQATLLSSQSAEEGDHD